ncbi:MAG: hypothetical protein KF832_13895 [Caldilineaceae bacterium]|nr:hypothetical protein [Caldilineaceae bacterium]
MATAAQLTDSAIEPVATAASNEVSSTESNKIVFTGTQRNMAVGTAMFITGALAFSMDLTHTFFANATAWTFVLWGLLFIYGSLLDVYQTYEVTDTTLTIRNPARFLLPTKVWAWENIQRIDVVVRRADAEYQDATAQVHYQEPGELTIEREDRVYDPELVRLIIEHAGLLPVDKKNPTDFTQLPKTKATYIWNRTGRMAA